jgi:hypothetical protein
VLSLYNNTIIRRRRGIYQGLADKTFFSWRTPSRGENGGTLAGDLLLTRQGLRKSVHKDRFKIGGSPHLTLTLRDGFRRERPLQLSWESPCFAIGQGQSLSAASGLAYADLCGATTLSNWTDVGPDDNHQRLRNERTISSRIPFPFRSPYCIW